MAFVGKVTAGEATGAIGATLYGTCTTQASEQVKVASVPGLDTLLPGLTIHVKFTNTNRAANPLLNIPTVGNDNIPICLYGATTPGTEVQRSWFAGSVLSMTYDGSVWQVNNWQDDTTYSNATTSAAGLMSAADKGILNNIEANRTTSKVYTNVATSAWAADSTYSNYPYKASLTCQGITANHFAYVCFHPDHVVSYVPAPVVVTAENTIYVWAMIDPGGSITVPTVLAILPDRT